MGSWVSTLLEHLTALQFNAHTHHFSEMPSKPTYSSAIVDAVRSGGSISRKALTSALSARGLTNNACIKTSLKAAVHTGLIEIKHTLSLGPTALEKMTEEQAAAYNDALNRAEQDRDKKTTAKEETAIRMNAVYARNFQEAMRQPTAMSRGALSLLVTCRDLK